MLKILSRFSNRSFARSATIFILIFSFIFTLFFWHLGSLTPGYSPTEKIALEQSDSLSEISINPIFAPHKLLQFGFGQINDSAMLARLPSIMLGILSLGCFYVVLRRWFGRMVAVLTTLIFASLPWVILISRSATPDVMYLSSIFLLAGFVWLSIAERKTLAIFGIAGSTVLIAYTPGMIWFLFVAAILWRRKIGSNLDSLSKLAMAGALMLFILALVPLGLAAANDLGVLKSIFMVPSEFSSFTEILKSILWGGLSFIWSTKDTYPLILGRLPLLSITAVVLSFFGFYIMWKRARIEFFSLLTLIIVAILGYGITQNLAVLSIAFPSFGILMGAGLRYLHAEWRSVFPLNPIPKALAMGLVIALVGLNVTFGVRYALAAWPNALSTKDTYVLE